MQQIDKLQPQRNTRVAICTYRNQDNYTIHHSMAEGHRQALTPSSRRHKTRHGPRQRRHTMHFFHSLFNLCPYVRCFHCALGLPAYDNTTCVCFSVLPLLVVFAWRSPILAPCIPLWLSFVVIASALSPTEKGMDRIRRVLLLGATCCWLVLLTITIVSNSKNVTAMTSSQCIYSFISDGDCDYDNNK